MIAGVNFRTVSSLLASYFFFQKIICKLTPPLFFEILTFLESIRNSGFPVTFTPPLTLLTSHWCPLIKYLLTTYFFGQT